MGPRSLLRGASLALLFLGSAQAGEPEIWAALHDARLLESLDGDPEGAIAIYELLLEDLESGTELWEQCILSMGRARMNMGDLDGARSALLLLTDRSSVKQDARAMLVRIEMQQRKVGSLPYVDPIGIGQSKWIRGWTRGALDDLHFTDEPEPCLAWELQVVHSQTDFIVLSLGVLEQRPERMEITVRSREFTSRIIVVLEDHDGGQWRSEILDIPTGDWTTIDVDLNALIRLSGENRMPDPRRLRSLIVQDMTGQVSAQQGSNRIEIKSTLLY
jgi:hypothetical protein